MLADLGHRGEHGMQINGSRAPFDIVPRRSARPTYPALWGHDAVRERRLIVDPDREARVRRGRAEKAAGIWESATRLHFSLNFRVNSQSLASCLTRERTLGGEWPNFRLHNPEAEEAVVLWQNTTIGLISFWWHGTRQHQGRSRVSISRLPSLLTLDVRELTAAQLARAKAVFDGFAERDFLPANEAWRDETRQALDRAVLIDLLGLPEDVLEPLAVLREQWCAEPTVHGGKGTRPA